MSGFNLYPTYPLYPQTLPTSTSISTSTSTTPSATGTTTISLNTTTSSPKSGQLSYILCVFTGQDVMVPLDSHTSHWVASIKFAKETGLVHLALTCARSMAHGQSSLAKTRTIRIDGPETVVLNVHVGPEIWTENYVTLSWEVRSTVFNKEQTWFRIIFSEDLLQKTIPKSSISPLDYFLAYMELARSTGNSIMKFSAPDIHQNVIRVAHLKSEKSKFKDQLDGLSIVFGKPAMLAPPPRPTPEEQALLDQEEEGQEPSLWSQERRAVQEGSKDESESEMESKSTGTGGTTLAKTTTATTTESQPLVNSKTRSFLKPINKNNNNNKTSQISTDQSTFRYSPTFSSSPSTPFPLPDIIRFTFLDDESATTPLEISTNLSTCYAALVQYIDRYNSMETRTELTNCGILGITRNVDAKSIREQQSSGGGGSSHHHHHHSQHSDPRRKNSSGSTNGSARGKERNSPHRSGSESGSSSGSSSSSNSSSNSSGGGTIPCQTTLVTIGGFSRATFACMLNYLLTGKVNRHQYLPSTRIEDQGQEQQQPQSFDLCDGIRTQSPEPLLTSTSPSRRSPFRFHYPHLEQPQQQYQQDHHQHQRHHRDLPPPPTTALPPPPPVIPEQTIFAVRRHSRYLTLTALDDHNTPSNGSPSSSSSSSGGGVGGREGRQLDWLTTVMRLKDRHHAAAHQKYQLCQQRQAELEQQQRQQRQQQQQQLQQSSHQPRSPPLLPRSDSPRLSSSTSHNLNPIVVSWENLYLISDTFEIFSLRKICHQEILKTLTIDNVVRIILKVALKPTSELKQDLFEFFLKHYDEIFSKEGGDPFRKHFAKKECRLLIDELLAKHVEQKL